MTPLLEIDDLHVAFDSGHNAVSVLRGVSLSAYRGQTLAIVGESGSGKSVTALAILRLLGDNARVASGQIRFDGADLLNLSDRDMRSVRGNRIAMIFQEPMSSLNPVLTIGEQVAEPLRTHQGLPAREALQRATALLERVAIPDAASRLGSYPHQFSGGMRQRVMIAMALACQPALIIADEPTTALDVTVQAQILSLLNTLVRDSGSAMILITHDLALVRRYAEQVCVMYAGRVVESGPTSLIFEKPLHPYTSALMASAPARAPAPKAILHAIPGQPPDPGRVTSGCSFAPRCRMAQAICQEIPPPVLSSPGGGSALCHFAEAASP
jgi:oligopeptide/dipeptide ABC transporter ATP-binding protein